MYIVNKIIDQKNNDYVCIPMPTVYNLFMSFIQDTCNEPYKLIEEIIEKKALIDIELSNDLKNLRLKSLDDFRKKFIGTKDEHRWIIDFTKYNIAYPLIAQT